MQGEDCKLTQREANILFEGATIDAANVISNYMNMIMTCVFYSPIIPQAIPLAMISSLLGYWTTKYNLLRRYKRPKMFGELMATFFANFMPWLVLAGTLGAYYFYSKKDGEAFKIDSSTLSANNKPR
jgi:hypothetical protein